MRRRLSRDPLARVNRAVADVEFPAAIWKTCPWQPREVIAEGLRQWLRCAGVALRDGKIVGMPSRAVDEAWHGFVLCTARYAEFCQEAYGEFLHHHPDDGSPGAGTETAGTAADQLSRTVVAWALVAAPGETCVLWDLDQRVGVAEPWGLPQVRVDAVLARLQDSAGLSR